MNWATRQAVSNPHEEAVMDRLKLAGWAVDRFGQALIPECHRAALRELDTPLRWLPDVIATKRRRVVLIDAKSGWRTDTPNYCLEKSAVDAAYWCLSAKLHVVYVMADFGVLWPSQVVKHGRFHNGRNTNGGSGTPYYLVAKNIAKSFDVVFGVAQ